MENNFTPGVPTSLNVPCVPPGRNDKLGASRVRHCSEGYQRRASCAGGGRTSDLSGHMIAYQMYLGINNATIPFDCNDSTDSVVMQFCPMT